MELEDDAANQVLYRIMGTEDIPAVLEAVARAFFEGEPVTAAARPPCTLGDWTRFTEMFLPHMAAEGHTVVAFDKATGKVLGALLNEDFVHPDPPAMEKFLDTSDGDWRPLMAMVEELEIQLMESHKIPPKAEERPSGTFFHLWMLGVASSARGRGVGSKLLRHSLLWAKQRGFKMAFAETTGAISTGMVKKHCSPKLDAFVDYASWDKMPTSEELKQLPSLGHLGLSMLSIDLTDFAWKDAE
ncbi:unnamed protein product [Symbiodinium natans]|uniref:N-acetyltransferase domain-containing protein n=1 Tax=Symbiodinium natans TaxID=878477 RepID=A0A812QEY5_9DINO|nr:unnamed protein product [Symbiodinium natans]